VDSRVDSQVDNFRPSSYKEGAARGVGQAENFPGLSACKARLFIYNI
jgi:hypothetical protein